MDESDRFAGEGLAEVDEVAGPLDLAVGANAADGNVGVVSGALDL